MRPLLPALATATVLFLAACSGGGSATPAPTPTSVMPSPEAPASADQTGDPGTAAAPACAPGTEPMATVYTGWPQAGRGTATGDMFPYLVSSQITVGPSRFLFTLIDSTNQVLAAPDVPVTVAFYNLAADPATPVSTTDAVFLDPGTGRGLYRASVDFTCAGDWGIVVIADLPTPLPSGAPSGAVASPARTPVRAQVVFEVRAAGTVPAIGAPAPRSDSPVATTAEDLARISTDDDPDPDFYRQTIAQAVTSGRPSAILFATPQFCQTAMCGPMLDMVKGIAADFKDQVTFVNVEPYKLRETPQGLQPDLDADGHLQPVPAVIEWGLRTEPYLFIVDADGRIFASFEGVLGEDEVRAALQEVVAAAAAGSPPAAGSPAA